MLLYYLPGATGKPDRAAIDAAGLGYALPGRFAAVGVTGGPDAKSGQIVAVGSDLLGYYPNRQRWRKIHGGKAWVGVWTDKPFDPDSIKRRDALDGHVVELGDGLPWEIPVARAHAPSDDLTPESAYRWFQALPESVGLDDAGNWETGEVVPRYRSLYRIATAWWEHSLGGQVETVETDEGLTLRFDDASAADAALLALATNYRIDKAEVALLGLFTTETMQPVLEALIDWPTRLEWLAQLEKKTASADPEPGSTDAGSEDSTPTTDRP